MGAPFPPVVSGRTSRSARWIQLLVGIIRGSHAAAQPLRTIPRVGVHRPLVASHPRARPVA